jgi:cell division protein FtsN
MIAFVFDRRSLVLLGTGAVFLALVLVAVGFLLGVQYGVLPPAAPQSTTAQANSSALPIRVAGMANDATDANAPEPEAGLGSSDTEPINGDGGVGFQDPSALDSMPYADAPAGDGPSIDEPTPAPAASPPAWPVPRENAEPGRSRTPATPALPAATPRFEPPADPIVDSRGGEPVPLAPSPQSVPDRPSRRDDAVEPQSETEAPDAPAPIAAAVTSDSGRFAVQVGAYRERLNCDAMVQKLTTRGFEPYVVEIVRDGQSPLYAVRVGRFGGRGEAAKVASALRSKAGVPVVVLSIG